MADFVKKIESIQGGLKADMNSEQEGSYLFATNIDPEGFAYSNSRITSTGYITPVQSNDFSAPGVNKLSSAPMWILTPGRDTNMYAYSYNGQITRYDLNFANETVLSSSIGGSTGNGAAYYNNYLYFATSADIHRYGPLDSSPTSQLSAWTAATSAGQPILSAVCPYPTTVAGAVTWPNHPMHVHVDNKLYFADYVSATGTGKACVNWISSNGDGSVMGGSRDALDIPFGYTITDIESFGNDLAILAIPIAKYNSALIKTGRAALFLWDTFSSSFYRQVDISDSLASSMINHNGELRIFSSSVGQRYLRLLGYSGGNSFRDIDYTFRTPPPLAGAIDTNGGMLAYGTTSIGTTWTNWAGVRTYGTRDARINPTAKHMIMSPKTLQTNPYITALSFADYTGKYPIIGSTGATGAALSQYSTSTDMSGSPTVWISAPISFGQEFEVSKIRIPLDIGINANSTITVYIFTDDAGGNSSTYIINNAVYSGQKIIDIGCAVKGSYNFSIQLSFSGTQGIGVRLPITIWGKTLRDN